MAPHGTRIDIHLKTELDLEQLSDHYLFTLKQTASTATQKNKTKKKQTKNCKKTPQFHVLSTKLQLTLRKKKYRETRGKQWTKFLEGFFEMLYLVSGCRFMSSLTNMLSSKKYKFMGRNRITFFYWLN